jgi:hypothetical protein
MQLIDLTSSITLHLPDDLLWSDEHHWTPATATVSYLLTGALLIESAVRQAGRPITLTAPDDMAWVTRSTVDQLYDWAAQPERQMQLRFIDARTFTVAFRHQDQAIESAPVLGFPLYTPDAANARYRIQLRLMTL